MLLCGVVFVFLLYIYIYIYIWCAGGGGECFNYCLFVLFGCCMFVLFAVGFVVVIFWGGSGFFVVVVGFFCWFFFGGLGVCFDVVVEVVSVGTVLRLVMASHHTSCRWYEYLINTLIFINQVYEYFANLNCHL